MDETLKKHTALLWRLSTVRLTGDKMPILHEPQLSTLGECLEEHFQYRTKRIFQNLFGFYFVGHLDNFLSLTKVSIAKLRVQLLGDLRIAQYIKGLFPFFYSAKNTDVERPNDPVQPPAQEKPE